MSLKLVVPALDAATVNAGIRARTDRRPARVLVSVAPPDHALQRSLVAESLLMAREPRRDRAPAR
jgi:hypothetical protein